jgi:periplasmic protein CpxP/Spy
MTMATNVAKTVTRLAGALAIVVSLAGIAVAQPGRGPGGMYGMDGPRGPGGMMGGMMGGPLGGLLGVHPNLPLPALNLSDAQREQVRAIMQGHRSEADALSKKAQAALEALRAATEGTLDEGAVNQQGQALGAVISEAALLRARIRGEVLAILTPEQQAEAAKIQAERQAHMQQRRQNMEQRRRQRTAPRP